jgi:peptidylprolyl isomerase
MRFALSSLLLLAGCSSSSTSRDAASSADLRVSATDGGAGNYVPPGYALVPFRSEQAQHSFAAAEMVTTAGRDYQAVLETDAGRIVFDLLEDDAPITVNSFVFLSLNHYFDGIAFHRVIAGFVAQGGDPNTLSADRGKWGQGGPGYRFGLETKPSLTYDGPGFVGMARTNDPNSNGSQFFITLAATHNLDGKYTIFARVSEGVEVLDKIARGEPPPAPTRMQRVYIVDRAK